MASARINVSLPIALALTVGLVAGEAGARTPHQTFANRQVAKGYHQRKGGMTQLGLGMKNVFKQTFSYRVKTLGARLLGDKAQAAQLRQKRVEVRTKGWQRIGSGLQTTAKGVANTTGGHAKRPFVAVGRGLATGAAMIAAGAAAGYQFAADSVRAGARKVASTRLAGAVELGAKLGYAGVRGTVKAARKMPSRLRGMGGYLVNQADSVGKGLGPGARKLVGRPAVAPNPIAPE